MKSPERITQKQEKTEILPHPITPRDISDLIAMNDDEFWRRLSNQTNLPMEVIIGELSAIWRKAEEVIQKSDVLVYVEHGGIGDNLYALIDSAIIAKRYPQKRIIVFGGPLVDLLVSNTPSNLSVAKSEVELDNLIKKSRGILLVNPQRINEGILEERYGSLLNNTPNAPLNMLLRRALGRGNTKRTQLNVIPETMPYGYLNLSTVLKTGIPYESPIAQLVRQHFGLSNSHSKNMFIDAYRQKLFDYFSSKPQPLFRAATLRYLLGIGSETIGGYFNHAPFAFEQYSSSSNAYDLIIIYDARSDKRKVPTPDMISKIIEERRKKSESERIGVIVGRDNPQIAREIHSRYPNTTLIEGNISTCFSHIMSSRQVITADTFWMHALNIAVHYREQTGKRFHIPEFTVLWNDRSPFSPLYFGPDRGTILLTSW